MPSFILDNDYHFLSSYTDTEGPNDIKCIFAMEEYPKSDGTFGPPDNAPAYFFHPRKTGFMFYNEFEIYGVVIGGEKLQQLILELHDTNIDVNRQGLCFSFISNYKERDSAYYPVHDLFNWRKYGVNVPNPPKELWSGIGIFVKPHECNSFDKTRTWDVDQSKEIRLNADDDLFISCYDGIGGPLNLWKVDSPSGHIKNVRLMGKIDCQWDMSRLEVNGVTLQGDKLRSLCQELNWSRVMVNANGWCLFYTKNPTFLEEHGNHYYKLLFRFNWKTYGVPTSQNCSCIWGRKYYLDEVQTITQLEFDPCDGDEDKPIQKICVSGGAKDEQNTYSLELEKTKQEVFQKEKELKDLGLELEKTKEGFCLKEKQLKDLSLELEKTKEGFCLKEKELKNLESQLQEKNKDLSLCEKQLDEKDQELNKLTNRLRAEQNEVITDSIYREYCSNNSFEKRLKNLCAVSRETHVVLAFARDYDDSDRHTNGIFKEFFDQNVTPFMIKTFKEDSPTTKFFLCIGDRSQKYPFYIENKRKWIANATASLKRIIDHYKFDGIDVYYTRSDTNAGDFIYAIGKVIGTLMKKRIITTASLAPCSFMHKLNSNFYAELYEKNSDNFEYVVFQTHDDGNDVSLNDAQALITLFNNLASSHKYPKDKLLVGHSILPKDWDTLPYPVILTALPQLIKSGVVQGTSVWALTNDKP